MNIFKILHRQRKNCSQDSIYNHRLFSLNIFTFCQAKPYQSFDRGFRQDRCFCLSGFINNIANNHINNDLKKIIVLDFLLGAGLVHPVRGLSSLVQSFKWLYIFTYLFSKMPNNLMPKLGVKDVENQKRVHENCLNADNNRFIQTLQRFQEYNENVITHYQSNLKEILFVQGLRHLRCLIISSASTLIRKNNFIDYNIFMSLHTYVQQLKVIMLLSVAFMLMFTSYTSVEGIITKFYQDKGHKYFGPISLIIVYTFFALSTIYSSIVINALGYRKIFILGVLFYTLFESSALIIYFSDNQYVLAFVVVAASVLCGCAAGNIWVAKNSYIGLISSKQNVNGFYGLAQGIRSISSVIGFILSVYIFKNYSGLEYFIIIAPISMLSIVLFCMIPQPQLTIQNTPNRHEANNGLAKIKIYLKLLLIQNNLEVYIFQSLNSIVAMIMAYFIYRINASIVTQKQSQTQYQFQNRTIYLLSFCLLWYGIGRCITGFLVKCLPKIDNFLFCQLSSWLCLTSMLFSLMSYITSSFGLICICSFLFGLSFTSTRISTNILIKQIFHNNLDMIGINYFVSSFAFVFGIFIVFIANKLSINLCFMIFVAFFAQVVRSTKKIRGKFTQSFDLGTELLTIQRYFFNNQSYLLTKIFNIIYLSFIICLASPYTSILSIPTISNALIARNYDPCNLLYGFMGQKHEKSKDD